MFRTLARRQEYNAANAPLRSYSNPYKAKKTWPPDFTKLSHKYQFRLERRYRRRTKLKWARPKWHKFVKTMTWGSILFVGVYGVLFMQVGDEGSPFDGIREWYKRTTNSIWTNRSNPPLDIARRDEQSPVAPAGES